MDSPDADVSERLARSRTLRVLLEGDGALYEGCPEQKGGCLPGTGGNETETCEHETKDGGCEKYNYKNFGGLPLVRGKAGKYWCLYFRS